jgi:hypothetical protein
MTFSAIRGRSHHAVNASHHLSRREKKQEEVMLQQQVSLYQQNRTTVPIMNEHTGTMTVEAERCGLGDIPLYWAEGIYWAWMRSAKARRTPNNAWSLPT